MSSRLKPKVIWVRSLVPNEKNSATSAIFAACRAARGISIMVPYWKGISFTPREAEFFSFGTNDLTQMTFGFSRDDAAKFLGSYYDTKIYENDPFAKLDQTGVGKLVQMAVKLGHETRPDIHMGICGEHGGEPTSVAFCHKVGLDYVSCSPFRVPIARLAAAQAAIAEEKEKPAEDAGTRTAEEKEPKRITKEQVDEKVDAAKAALKEAAEQLAYLAVGATGEVRDVVSTGFKSLLAGLEEAKKTYGETRNK